MRNKVLIKLTLMLVVLLICAFFFIGPKTKDAPLFSRLNLGLDLKGGIHMTVRVVTDDAVYQELNQAADRISQDYKSQNIPFVSARRVKGSDYAVEVLGVNVSKAKEAREYLESTFSRKYAIRSMTQEGTTNFTIVMNSSEVKELRESTVRQALETIRRRVDALGVSEPTLQTHGVSGQDVDDQIIVELPGIDDPDRVTQLLSNTAQLELRLVKRENGGPFESIESAIQANGGFIPDEYEIVKYRNERDQQGGLQYLVINRVAIITGKDLKDARPDQDSNGAHIVSFFLKADGAKAFARATEQHVNEYLAIVLDDVVKTYPKINSRIEESGIIEGNFSEQSAADLALLLRSGALPASLEILGQRSVGASLGNDSIKSGVYASLIGFGFIILGMLVYYKKSGINAIACLIANAVILMGFMGAVGATLTLPGIAGIILTIGMAVDANILIFERIREEMRSGKTVRSAIETGFGKVFWTIFDSNLTTLISALFLFQFGTGPIKGFAITLIVGLVANVFTAVWMSRWLFEWILGDRRVEELSI